MKIKTIPERWVVVKVTNRGEEPFEKVLAGWYGGYLGSDEWRFSSLIETVVDNGDHYEFHNLSGSTYICFKEGGYGMNMLMQSIFDHYKAGIEELGGKLEVVESYNPHAEEDREYRESHKEEFEEGEEFPKESQEDSEC